MQFTLIAEEDEIRDEVQRVEIAVGDRQVTGRQTEQIEGRDLRRRRPVRAQSGNMRLTFEIGDQQQAGLGVRQFGQGFGRGSAARGRPTSSIALHIHALDAPDEKIVDQRRSPRNIPPDRRSRRWAAAATRSISFAANGAVSGWIAAR